MDLPRSSTIKSSRVVAIRRIFAIVPPVPAGIKRPTRKLNKKARQLPAGLFDLSLKLYYSAAVCVISVSIAFAASPPVDLRRSSTIKSSRVVAIRRICAIVPPVPAGIKRPTMTFSFSPCNVSILPATAASVSTRVVSWNEAADMNEGVCNDALVIPNRTGLPEAGFLPSSIRRSLTSSSSMRSTLSPAI